MVPYWQFGLVPILAIALATDLKSRKIYNWLTFPAMIVGLGLSIAFGGLMGLQASLIGFAVGTAVFVLGFFMGGAMGAGDVKLMAAIGIWLGWPSIMGTVLYVTVFGGLFAIISGLYNGTLVKMFSNIYHFCKNFLVFHTITPITKENSAADFMPYGVSIVCGTLLALFFPDPAMLLGMVPGHH